jgi:hypothetical protein
MKTSKEVKLPIFGGTGNREIMGFASSVNEASKLIRRLIDVPKGFSLHVWQRETWLREVLEVPDGFVFSVSYKFG